jgi:hypothetical protein
MIPNATPALTGSAQDPGNPNMPTAHRPISLLTKC